MDTYYSDAERQFVEQSLESQSISEWLSKYSPKGVKKFLAKYYRQREQWRVVGAHRLKEKHEWLTIDMQRAERVLFYIQQKKLFDLQCLWRAEQAEVPGVKHGAGFCDLEENIRSLDFLPPITPEELQLLKDWLMDYDESKSLYPQDGWQNYDRFIRKNVEQWNLPSLYPYLNFKTNAVSLWRVLPDIRGKKEKKYMRAAIESRIQSHEEKVAAQPPTEPIDERPKLYGFSEEFDAFATAFEDHSVNELRVAYDESGPLHEDHALNSAIETLQNAQEPVAMEENADWRAGIIYTAWKYERMRLLPALDVAYENYRFRLQMGIGFAQDEPHVEGENLTREAAVWAREILDGREALGEPRDFNF